MGETVLKNNALILLLCLVFFGSPVDARAMEIEAITKPGGDVTLSFVQPGKIQKILTNEGSLIERGELLAVLEDSVEQIQYKMLSAKKEDTTQLAIISTELAQKISDLQLMEEGLNEGAIPAWDVEHARMAVENARLNEQLALFEKRQDDLKVQEIKAILNQLRLSSPIGGMVDEIMVKEGESVQATSPVVRIVSINQLVLDVATPLEQAKELTPGQKVEIRCSDNTVLNGTVENISIVSDAAAGTIRVRVKAENPDRRPSGERVSVSFADSEA